MIQSARVVFPTDIGRLRAVLAKVANVPKRNASFCGTGTRGFEAFPKIKHSANVIAEIVEPEETLFVVLALLFPPPPPPPPACLAF